jgi:hypothetical protein
MNLKRTFLLIFVARRSTLLARVCLFGFDSFAMKTKANDYSSIYIKHMSIPSGSKHINLLLIEKSLQIEKSGNE